MTADDGIIAAPAHRARVTEVGRVIDLSGAPLTIGVRGGCVVIRPTAVAGNVLDEARCETLAQLLTRAQWAAARDKEE
jgi:hypothetical protein